MGNLMTYSGISAKVKAMERWRIGDEQFAEMETLETVAEAVSFICRFLPYREIFGGAEDDKMHRGMIEQRLNLSQYRDFAKLYKFANLKQRKFLDLYFMHYEISIIKTCLRNAVGSREQKQDLSLFRDFFERHSSIDLIKLSESQSIEEFVANLRDTSYGTALSGLNSEGPISLPACETALDMLYFRTIWKIREKYLSKADKKIITQCFGTKMDMLNLQWICRAKKYYKLSSGGIYAMIIPINLHLTKKEISAMAEAESLEQVYEIIKNTWYGKLDILSGEEYEGLDQFAREINDRIYMMTSRKEPYSIAILNSYLYFKEREIERIITTIERIRYGVTAT